ncbi:uncharacterized protein EV420DRAFT_440108 [Desarmillaria tabescens]|uniref:HBS1-like protein N-terminal domain-containing protein n=1 Tax=Armillaria tabescens TaxID=1929756 RepID=A0AA39NLU0_ARMTA|nr:uncharacterized protein EV420DRAFT_440108 [Desarmillaria tabescens]KAK0468009.1 hypothetical protein EV420DRAFT_440108 [Desarmillaria tabescens]
MSRHRDVRNINLDDELDDDALSDGGEEEMTEQYQAELNASFEQVLDVIGGEETTGISEREIKEYLWQCYFKVDQTIEWALDEQERRRLARERKDIDSNQGVPTVVLDEHLPNHYSSESSQMPAHYENNGRSRVPLIVLAQQQQRMQQQEEMQRQMQNYELVNDEESSTEATPQLPRRMLSTITEKSERTEPYWSPNTQYNQNPPPPSSITTSYGQVINRDTQYETHVSENPNSIPPSPSPSVVRRLSQYSPPPSLLRSDSRSSTSSAHAPSVSVPPIDTIPDIPDTNSRSTRHVPAPVKKTSKLSQLAANARASNMSLAKTERSGPSGSAIDEGSVRTWPALRPTATSIPPSPSPLPATRLSTHSSAHSSTTSIIRKAVQTAMELEALDQQRPPKVPPKDPPRDPTPAPTDSVPASNDPIPASNNPTPAPSQSRSLEPQTPTPPTSPRRALSINRPAAPTPSRKAELPSPDTVRKPSKLALLAQSKAAPKAVARPIPTKGPSLLDSDIGRKPKPGQHFTKYLAPVANGDTVTTAITYSYESLRTLTDPKRPPEEAPYVVTLEEALEKKPSKLAAKIKKMQEKHRSIVLPEHEEVELPSAPPLFLPSSAPRALPSAFATILVDDLTSSKHKAKQKDGHHKSKTKHRRQDSAEEGIRHSREEAAPIVPGLASPAAFKFDEPSPDDVVMRARQGSALANKGALPSAARTKASSSTKA